MQTPTNTRLYLLGIVCGIYYCLSAQAAETALVSTEKQIGLLELYTSEGCSSCPPADMWLSALKDNPHLWNEFIPLAFHVDYWDYIGWHDRFAEHVFSQRQRRYARQNSLDAVYTPGFLYNGKEWRQWYESRQPKFPTAKESGILRVRVNAKKVSVTYTSKDALEEALIINVALLGFDLSTTVKAGENKGRKLRHDFVVIGLQKTPLKQTGDREYLGTAELPETAIRAPRLGIAVWVSKATRQQPLQAVGGWLNLKTAVGSR